MQETYKNKIKTYCVKCKKDTENINPKMFRMELCNQNVLFAELKDQDLLKIKKQKDY